MMYFVSLLYVVTAVIGLTIYYFTKFNTWIWPRQCDNIIKPNMENHWTDDDSDSEVFQPQHLHLFPRPKRFKLGDHSNNDQKTDISSEVVELTSEEEVSMSSTCEEPTSTISNDSTSNYKQVQLYHSAFKWERKKEIPEVPIHQNVQLNNVDATPRQYEGKNYMIRGVNVAFPVEPYGSQKTVMERVVISCTKSQNCMIESPTGSGKTLALLCGSLAWQDHLIATRKPAPKKVDGIRSSTSTSNNKGHKPSLDTPCMDMDTSSKTIDELFDQPGAVEEPSRDDNAIPTIYYGTRTHKQIEQVIRELKKTKYSTKKMTILSSRNQTCLYDTKENKNDLCNKLLDPRQGPSCAYYTRLQKLSMDSQSLQRLGLVDPWDIEELVAFSKEQSICPYFAARDLLQRAEIVFCPYNYLIDPDIRSAMKISLLNEIIILDEAHNIENICRDTASFAFEETDLVSAIDECQTHVLNPRAEDEVRGFLGIISHYLTTMLNFIKIQTLGENCDNNETLFSPHWTGSELIKLLEIHHLGGTNYSSFKRASELAIQDNDALKEALKSPMKSRKELPKVVISDAVSNLLTRLLRAIEVLHNENIASDYRCCVSERKSQIASPFKEDKWMSKKSRSSKRIRTLELLCMNPAVVFKPISNQTRCIILASGTLSPMDSFKSELGVDFPCIANAPHVIPKDHCYVRHIPRGPNGVELRAVATVIKQWSFQDDFGQLVLQVCRAVPHGILCFFSSYYSMNVLVERWRQTEVWTKLEKVKNIFMEPRSNYDLHEVMMAYREQIKFTSKGPHEGITGALFLVVFRGKVSEGIDFSDNEARCVITLGIPYAVRTEPSVKMKYDYNDANKISKNLMDGYKWYATQAFRALNQALGRCIRHKNDWGAILLVDERFQNPQFAQYLPKWIKGMIQSSSCDTIEQDLQQFCQQREKIMAYSKEEEDMC